MKIIKSFKYDELIGKKKNNIRIILFSENGYIALNNKRLIPSINDNNITKNEIIVNKFKNKYNNCIEIIEDVGIIREKYIDGTVEIKYYLAFLEKNSIKNDKLNWYESNKLLTIIKDKSDEIIIKYFFSKKNDIWLKLYSNYINKEYRDWQEYFNTKMKLKMPFIKQVIKHYDKEKPVLECGCGLGKTSIYLASLGIKTYAMDLEKDMVSKTKELTKKYNIDNEVTCLCGNILNIPYKNKYFSVTHSSGVLEHFQDEEIIKIINEQLRVADYMVFSVPTKYFEKKMLGNERFMSRQEWRKIINQSNGIIIKEAGYHYKKIKKRIIDILHKPKRLFKPIALYTFVIKEREEI